MQPLDGANLISAQSIDEAIQRATAQGVNHLWLVGGGQLASSFLDAGLLTHLSLSEMPIDLGQGIPLFARHKLASIPALGRIEIPKPGFRQIDVTIRTPNTGE